MSFGQSDFTELFWPFHDFNVHEWLAGRVPLWNDSIYGGQPQLASIEAAVFYPLSIVEVILAGARDPMTGIFTRMWLDTWIAAVGLYLLARRLTGQRPAAALAAVAFAFSGFMLGYGANQMDRMEALTFLPLGLFFLDRALAPALPRPPLSPSAQDRERAGVREPLRARPSTLTCWSLVNAWLAGWCLACTVLGGYPQLWLIVPPAVVGLALGRGRQWRQSLAALAITAVAGLSLAAVQILPSVEFLLSSERSVYLGEGYGYAWHQLLGLLVTGADGDKGMYVGVLPILLALLAIVLGRQRRQVWCWLALSALGVLLALGDTTPLYPAVFSHLGFGLFRGQNRNIALAVLSLSVLGGLGVASLCERVGPKLARIAAVLPLLAAADLLGTNWGNNWPGPAFLPTQAHAPHVLAALQAEQQREPMRYVVDHPFEFFVPNESYRAGLQSLDGYLNFKVGRTFEILDKADLWRQWQLFNVRYIVTQRPLSGDGIAEVPDVSDGPVRLYRMQFPLPRAYMVFRATNAGGPTAALQDVLAPSFDPGSTAVLEQSLGAPLASPPSGQQQVTTTVLDPQDVRIRVSAPADGLLVISEPYYPGWHALLDGREVPLMRADYALEAVSMPVGEHEVSLSYEPTSFRVGAAISLASIAGFFVLVLLAGLRSRRSARVTSASAGVSHL